MFEAASYIKGNATRYKYIFLLCLEWRHTLPERGGHYEAHRTEQEQMKEKGTNTGQFKEGQTDTEKLRHQGNSI